MTDAPPLNSRDLERKMTLWVESLSSKRIFRRLKVVASPIQQDGNGSISITVTDGLLSIATKPFHFNVRTMEWPVLYQNLKAMLMASFAAHLDTILAPELVLEGTLGVDVVRGDTDGEEVYAFSGD